MLELTGVAEVAAFSLKKNLISEKSPYGPPKKYFDKFHVIHHFLGNFMLNLNLESAFRNIQNKRNFSKIKFFYYFYEFSHTVPIF